MSQQSGKRPRRRRWQTIGGFGVEDVFALEALRPLGGNYLPWTGFALSPSSLLRVVNEAMLNECRFIFEAGAGLSTVFLARLLKQWGGGEAKLVSVDDSEVWVQKVQGFLDAEDLGDVVSLVHTPLTPWTPPTSAETADGEWRFELPDRWYDAATVHRAIGDRMIDLLLVDGPKGRSSISRYPAVPELADNIDSNTIVILDDVGRDYEAEILDRWSALLGVAFSTQRRQTIAVSHSGPKPPNP